jgi:hypothetical protein
LFQLISCAASNSVVAPQHISVTYDQGSRHSKSPEFVMGFGKPCRRLTAELILHLPSISCSHGCRCAMPHVAR